MEITEWVLHYSVIWCLCSLTLPTGKTQRQGCRAGSCAASSPHREVPWLEGSAGGPGLVSAFLQSCRGAVTPAQPSCHGSCFPRAQEPPHDGAAVLIPSVIVAVFTTSSCFPSARLDHGSPGWSSAGRLSATCPGTKLVLP